MRHWWNSCGNLSAGKDKVQTSIFGQPTLLTMTAGVIKESDAGERRVALVPQTIARLRKNGLDVLVQSGAGEKAGFNDGTYVDSGARIVTNVEAWQADTVVTVNPVAERDLDRLRSAAVLIGFMRPLDEPERMAQMAAHGVTGIAMELVPRISRAQKMDALSAMASLAGYKAALMGANMLPRFFPLLTTAAGTVRPATVTVLGAGVAGLQAIATARRLGARVWGYDIREAAREEVKSLGAQFVELDLELDDMQDQGGYAKALMAAKAEQQTRLLVPHLAKSDVVITTAQIPGRPAPLLVTREAVEAMKPGAVIVDLAASTGGNCSLTKPDQVVDHNHVRICGPTNLPASMAEHASFLYARTVAAMLGEFVEDGTFKADFDDEIFSQACVSHNGVVVHPRVRALIETR